MLIVVFALRPWRVATEDGFDERPKSGCRLATVLGLPGWVVAHKKTPAVRPRMMNDAERMYLVLGRLKKDNYRPVQFDYQ